MYKLIKVNGFVNIDLLNFDLIKLWLFDLISSKFISSICHSFIQIGTNQVHILVSLREILISMSIDIYFWRKSFECDYAACWMSKNRPLCKFVGMRLVRVGWDYTVICVGT